jgi:hypothetical protein
MVLPFGHEPFGSELKAELLKAEWRFSSLYGKPYTMSTAM